MSGWIKLHRGSRDTDGIALSKVYSEWEAWTWILENAAWKDMERRNSKGESIIVKRSQLHTSLRALANVFGWSKKRVETFLERLVTVRKLGTAKGQSGTLLTVLNYAKYQDIGDSQEPDKGTVGGQSGDTQEEGKEIKEDKKGAAPAKNHSLPDGWKPSQFGAGSKCREIVDGWHPEFLEIQIEKFKANHSAKGSKFKDWQQAWKTWVLNSLQFSPVKKEEEEIVVGI